MKTWRSLVLVIRGHETKTKYTILSINTCKIFFQPLDVEEPNIFNGSILSNSPSQSLGCELDICLSFRKRRRLSRFLNER